MAAFSLPGTDSSEPDPVDAAYQGWRGVESPASTGALLRALKPTMDKGISVYVGPGASPNVSGQAKQLTLAAARTYDPAMNTRLTTHVMNHLQGLRRVARQQSQIIRMPERLALDRSTLFQAEQDLEDRLGRSATTPELADHTGLSVRRIARIRSLQEPRAEGSFVSPETGEEAALPTTQFDQSSAIAEAIYHDLLPRDQQILELTLGLHGRQPLSNAQIAAKLRLTPGAISQRKAIIQRMYNQLMETGLF